MSDSPWLTSESYLFRFLESIRKGGLIDPMNGYCDPDSVSIVGTNYRETIVAHQRSTRSRAVVLTLSDEVFRVGRDIAIYAPERMTAMADALAAVYPNFVGSEYLPDQAARAQFPGVMHQDVTNLSFEPESFDVYLTCDVLEHVPDVQAKLREARRILKPGGKMIGTFPFSYGKEESTVKAELRDGEIVYLTEPEYHGNPVDAKGCLVFTIPGWEIISWARAAGFRDAYFKAIGSRRYGVRSSEIAVALVFVAEA